MSSPSLTHKCVSWPSAASECALCTAMLTMGPGCFQARLFSQRKIIGGENENSVSAQWRQWPPVRHFSFYAFARELRLANLLITSHTVAPTPATAAMPVTNEPSH